MLTVNISQCLLVFVSLQSIFASLEMLHETGRNSQNRFIGSSQGESNDKSDAVKSELMPMHAGKEASKIYETLHWAKKDEIKFDARGS